MKKLISLILALILAISLVACTDKKGDDPDEGTLDDFSNIFKDGFELPKVPITWD